MITSVNPINPINHWRLMDISGIMDIMVDINVGKKQCHKPSSKLP